jgi:DNA polymerase-3 subunit gamma/tau
MLKLHSFQGKSMQNFVVSARKYRPVNFETVVGQSHITSTLRHAILTSHLAQAFLFCGPRGVGKTTCARILAKTINCSTVSKDGEACGECASCQSFQNQNSLNIYELDGASNNSVENIRELIEQVRTPPHYGNYKVYIIDEVHMLSTAAFNAFLKTLEEPPSYAIFILATTEKHKILPTILSRCQIFDFNRIKNQDIASQLEKVALLEGIPFENEALLQIARKAEGGMRDALSMFDMISTFSTDRKVSLEATLENLHILDSDYYFKILDYILEGNNSGLLLIYDEILRKGFDGHHFLTGLCDHLRNLLLAVDPATHEILEAGGETLEKIRKQISQCGPGFLLNLLSMANQAELQYKNSRHQRLLVELCLMKMGNLRKMMRHSAERQKTETSSSAGFRNPQPSIREIKTITEERRVQFKKTPSIKSEEQAGATSLPTIDPSDKPNIEKKDLNLSTAREAYLEWHKANQTAPFSNWSLAVKEEITENGFVLSFARGSIAGDAFSEELILIKSFFHQNFSKSPDFNIAWLDNSEEKSLNPYTNLDKYKYLAEKNPKLEQLRKILNLDFS